MSEKMTLDEIVTRITDECPDNEYTHDALNALRHLATLPAAVPDGWKLVPIEPTEAMRDAANELPEVFSVGAEWPAMLSAAPEAMLTRRHRPASRGRVHPSLLRKLIRELHLNND